MKATIYDLSNAVDRKIQPNRTHFNQERDTIHLVDGMTDKKLHIYIMLGSFHKITMIPIEIYIHA
jgi:hypothetical protein